MHGPACGGGLALALAADVRVAGESVRMNAAFIRLGLSACDVGVSYFLPRLVGASVAAELLLTGNFIDAARAERTGLVSRVVPDAELDDAARAMADDMLRNSPLGLRLMPQPQPFVAGRRRGLIRQGCLATVTYVKQISEHVDAHALLAFAKQRGDRDFKVLPNKIEQRCFQRGYRVNCDAQVESLRAAAP